MKRAYSFKKNLFTILFTISSYVIFAQSNDGAIDTNNKGSFFIEAGYGRFLAIADVGPAYGLDAGIFILENFVIKVKTGAYTLGIDNSDFIYGLGAKYYLAGRVPLELNYTRFNDNYLSEYALGYVVYKRPKIYVEPSIGLILGEIDSYLRTSLKMTFIF